ncbi:DUF6461 domain-containing protein [Actinomadura livida]|uniref:Uncharacterized protein n=1 Tax=Actinomadura livida TaxID=79909 RepID=A0A7W7ICX9_9ACTN|nr:MULTISPECIES: DUF6461 domain-containing protein [Actinomadura]MBB4774790.1 hypothetical protein [Actinomadura catellatispora]GGU05981.1 hypothetical protein GCM10010208_32830 [Actinomadura livida]
MVGPSVHPAEAQWGWIRRRLPLAGCLTFVRDRSPEQLVDHFDCDARTASMRTLARAMQEHRDRDHVRAGRSGEWAFAIEPRSLAGYLDGVARRLSAGTEAAVVSWTAKPTDYFGFFVDGALATSFEPVDPSRRDGATPDRFLPQLSEFGPGRPVPRLPSGRRDPRALSRRRRDPVVEALAVLTLAEGVLVPEALAIGPLLTCPYRSRPPSPTAGTS